MSGLKHDTQSPPPIVRPVPQRAAQVFVAQPEAAATPAPPLSQSDVLDLGGGHTTSLTQLRDELASVRVTEQLIPHGQHSLRQQALKTLDGDTLFVGGCVGDGHHGAVFVVARYEDNQRNIYALKVQSVERAGWARAQTFERKLERRFFSEVALLRRAQSPLKPVALFANHRPHLQLMTLMPLQQGTLRELSTECADVPSRMQLADAIWMQLAPALRDLHETHQVFSVDIKPENILVSARGELMFSDFGLGSMARRSSDARGTPAFMPPEMILHVLPRTSAEGFEITRKAGEFDQAKAELWQLGTTLLEILAAKAPFYSEQLRHLNKYTHIDFLQRFIERHDQAWQTWPARRRLDIIRRPHERAHYVDTLLAESLMPIERGNRALAAAFAMVRYEPEARTLVLPQGDSELNVRRHQLQSFVAQLACGLDNEVKRATARLEKIVAPLRITLPLLSPEELSNPFDDTHAAWSDESASPWSSLTHEVVAAEQASETAVPKRSESSDEAQFWHTPAESSKTSKDRA